MLYEYGHQWWLWYGVRTGAVTRSPVRMSRPPHQPAPEAWKARPTESATPNPGPERVVRGGSPVLIFVTREAWRVIRIWRKASGA
jgi:hypothetical protein